MKQQIEELIKEIEEKRDDYKKATDKAITIESYDFGKALVRDHDYFLSRLKEIAQNL